MAKISQYFKDKAKTIKDYPKTLMKAVYGDDGKRLDNIIRDITSDIDSTKAKIGTTDISKYGDGTVTGAIKAACDKSDANETAIADVNSNLYNAKNPVMLYDISTKSYNANDFLGGNIDMSAYSGFLIYYSDRAGGYQKSSYFTGKMSGMYQALDFTDDHDNHYFAGVQVRGNGLFVEIVGANKPFIWRLYGIPA